MDESCNATWSSRFVGGSAIRWVKLPTFAWQAPLLNFAQGSNPNPHAIFTGSNVRQINRTSTSQYHSTKRRSLFQQQTPLTLSKWPQKPKSSTVPHLNPSPKSTPLPLTHPPHRDLQAKPRSELTEYELNILEQHEFTSGPLSLLQTAVRNHTQILISLRNNRKLLARVKAFDRHCNMVLENVREMWQETPRLANGQKGRPVSKDRFVSKMFLRGDGVVLVVLS